MAPRTPRAGTTLCCVRIGHQDFVLSLDKGLKLVALMKDSIECDSDFTSRLTETVYHRSESQPAISMEVLSPGQFVNKPHPKYAASGDGE